MRLAGPVHRLRGAGDVVRARHPQAFADAIAACQLTSASAPTTFALDPVQTFRQTVRVHHQIVVRKGRRRQEVGTAYDERIEPQLSRHLVEEAFEGKTDVDGSMTAEGTTRRRVGKNATARVLDIVQVIDRVKHRAGIQDRHHAITRVRTATLIAIAFDRSDASILAQADLQADVSLRPPAMRDESLLA